MGRSVQFAPPAARSTPKHHFYDLLWPRPGRRVVGVFLCEALDILQAPFHWHQALGNTVPCAGAKKSCEYCRDGKGRVFKTFLASWNPDNGKRFGLVIGEAAFDGLCHRDPSSCNLRGQSYVATRAGGARGLVTFQLWPARDLYSGEVALPPCHDLKPTIEHLHGCTVRKAVP